MPSAKYALGKPPRAFRFRASTRASNLFVAASKFGNWTGINIKISGKGCVLKPLIVLLLALGLTGCIRSEPPADLTIINGAEPESLDPAIITGQPDMRVVKCLFEGLTRLEGTNATPVPALADRWDISPDGKIYTFHLRSNAVWSTGQPITADDVVWSWRRALDPDTAADYAGQLYGGARSIPARRRITRASSTSSSMRRNTTQAGPMRRTASPSQRKMSPSAR